MANRLLHESSPYLLQHAQNPVDWYPWGAEALERAKAEQKPIFLSIGYSACHWCHVMEHESFENPQIAQQLNDHFVCIKVDREERPDLDQIYMTAVQLISGRGGWPMSVFLTPDLQPFFGGTYWPPHSRMGLPGFDQVLTAVEEAWRNRRPQAIEQAQQLTERIGAVGAPGGVDAELDRRLLDGAASHLLRVHDSSWGGFGEAPKFPHALDLQLLLRVWRRQPREELLHAVQLTLDRMAAGGIYDHLGGGFARYSVDARWLVPHFEKMLYDNALLAAAYLDAYLATGEPRHADVVRETLDYVLRDMTDGTGGFHCAEDADSEGEEGRFYLWSHQEIHDVLGEELAHRFCDVYDVTPGGNFEGHNILHLPRTIAQVAQLRRWPLPELMDQLRQARGKLLARRAQRVRPGKDDKVIVSWNGLMIDAMARAARALDEPRYLVAATRAAEFLQDQLGRDGRLLHCWRAGRAHLAAYLDDYTALANGLVSLYEASFDPRWIRWALELMDQVLQRFADPAGGPLYFTADDHERLITRSRDLHDSSVPGGNGLAAYVLLRLSHLVERIDYRQSAHQILLAAGSLMRHAPSATGQLLLAVDLYLGPVHQIAVVTDCDAAGLRAELRPLNQRFLPRTVLAARCAGVAPRANDTDPLAPLFRNRPVVDGMTTFYVCEDTACWPPIAGPQGVATVTERLSQGES